jgi:DNA-directed RNA polymerase subunit A'
MLANVKRVRFGILGDDDVLALSACVIDSSSTSGGAGTVYDRRLGAVDARKECPTCDRDQWACPGHFGHVELNTPVIIFYKLCAQIARCFCLDCHRLLCDAALLRANGVAMDVDKRIKFVGAITYCARCRTPQPLIRLNAKEYTIRATFKQGSRQASRELTPLILKAVFDGVVDEDVRALCIDPRMFHPRALVLTKFAVIPTCCRPRRITPKGASDDDLSLMLADVVKYNNALGRATAGEPAYAKALAALKAVALAYCDNSRGKLTHTSNHKPMMGLSERIGKKRGFIRGFMMGKRCDNTARTVVGPDATLQLDQVGVPEEIARALTVREYVTPLTIERLRALINDEAADAVARVVKPNGELINVAVARVAPATTLYHGDEVRHADGSRSIITDRRCVLLPTDVIARDGKLIAYAPATPRRFDDIAIGDVVERYIRDGDTVLINRQPTLHRNSMVALRAVVLAGLTLRFNLAGVTQMNMDFDGDESNMWVFQHLESIAELEVLVNAMRNILSSQANKSEIAIVQDSLLAAYQMTVETRIISRADFMQCIMRTSAFERYPNYSARLDEARRARGEGARAPLAAHSLFAFILPRDFYYASSSDNGLTIRGGIVTRGFFDKAALKGGHDSIIRLLCLEYGERVTATFVDDMQFLTNAWLELDPFSVLLEDCVTTPASRAEIEAVVRKYYAAADRVAASTDDPLMRETRTSSELNKARDTSMRFAKESLRARNNFKFAVESGSKGDYFNVTQISGQLGQQYVGGQRPAATLTNGTRTLVHYPPIITDNWRRYESRGYVAAAFIGGMNPQQTFMHAMSGREGMTSTALNTSASGYAQRKLIKANEDLKVHYDGTVRDSTGSLYQFAYGNHGFDPAKVTFLDRGRVRVVDLERYARRYADDTMARALTDVEIETTIDRCRWRCQIPREIYERMRDARETFLRDQLRAVRCVTARINAMLDYVVERYHTSRATPGDAVGIICAQSIGERQTQANLDVFHSAGKLRESVVGGFEAILNVSRVAPANRRCVVYFKKAYASAADLRDAIGCSIAAIDLRRLATTTAPRQTDDDDGEGLGCATVSLCRSLRPRSAVRPQRRSRSTIGRSDAVDPSTNNRSRTPGNAFVIPRRDVVGISSRRYEFNTRLMYALRVNPATASHTLARCSLPASPKTAMALAEIVSCEYDAWGVTVTTRGTREARRRAFDALERVNVCGIDGITAMHVGHDGREWYVVTEGSNVRGLLRHELVDGARLYCNDIAETYDSLGLAAVRRMMFDDIKKHVAQVNNAHIQLLVDQMTVRGRPMSVTRYTNRTNNRGVLGKATFEESGRVLENAAGRTETDDVTSGVSSALMFGNRPPLGTGMIDVLIDVDACVKCGGRDPRVPRSRTDR